jgi:hypothetical protein
MLATLAALLGVIIGALLSGVGLESYKRHRDRQGLASALAGEIFAILHMTSKRNHVVWFTAMAKQLEADQPVKIPDIVQRPLQLDPVIASLVDRLGLLGANLPERITTFYHYVNGVRLDIVNLVDGKFDHDLKQKANLIREDLALWDETIKLGGDIRKDLHRIAEESWWPVGLWRRMIQSANARIRRLRADKPRQTPGQ